MDKDLCCDILPATLINKNFVEGEPECNYELYLLELVNESMWFRKNVDFKEEGTRGLGYKINIDFKAEEIKEFYIVFGVIENEQ